MSAKRSAGNDFRIRLEKLCREKNDAAKQEAERLASEQVTRLPLASVISSRDELAEQIDIITRSFYRGAGTSYEDDYDFTLNALGDDTFWPQFTQVLQMQKSFQYVYYRVKKDPDPSAPDEANLDKSLAKVIADEFGVVDSLNAPLLRLLLALGHFARKAHAIAYPLVVELLSIRRQFDFLFRPMSAEQAEHFAGTLRKAVSSLSAERELCSQEELDKFLDEPPNPGTDDEDEDILPFVCDCDNPEDATDESRHLCQAAYERRVKPLRQPTLTPAGPRMPLELLRDLTRKLADDLEHGKITTDSPADFYRYEILNDLLKLETTPIYCEYHWDPEKANRPEPFMRMSEKPIFVEQPENAIKEEILADLDRFIDCGMKIARRIGSKSLADWQNCALIVKNRVELAMRGNFRQKREIDMKLVEFDRSLQKARAQLWADVKANGGSVEGNVASVGKEIADEVTNRINKHTTVKTNELKRVIQADSTKERTDKRSESERKQINEVMNLYIYRKHVKHVRANLFGICGFIFHKWAREGKTGGFGSKQKLRDKARYDYKNSYDLKAKIAELTLTPPE